MKRKGIMSLVSLVATVSASVGCSIGNAQAKCPTIRDSETAPLAVLYARNNSSEPDNYHQATYSFRHMMQGNTAVTFNNFELQFTKGRPDMFHVNMVTDDLSKIYDLGKGSCKDIQSKLPERRKSQPMAWLYSSEASPAENLPADEVAVREGNCYLVMSSDTDGKTTTLFYVRQHVKNEMVILDQIEVLELTCSGRYEAR